MLPWQWYIRFCGFTGSSSGSYNRLRGGGYASWISRWRLAVWKPRSLPEVVRRMCTAAPEVAAAYAQLASTRRYGGDWRRIDVFLSIVSVSAQSRRLAPRACQTCNNPRHAITWPFTAFVTSTILFPCWSIISYITVPAAETVFWRGTVGQSIMNWTYMKKKLV